MKYLNFKLAAIIAFISVSIIGANAFYSNVFKEGCTGICLTSVNDQYAGHGSTLKGEGRPTYNQIKRSATVAVNGASIKSVFVIDYDTGFSLLSSKLFTAKVNEIKGAAIKGDTVVVRITSPGGSALACASDYNKVLELKDRGIKVIATVDYAALSCGYYLAAAADTIYAGSGAWVGNIGSVMVMDASKSARERTVVGSTRTKELLVGAVAKGEKDTEILKKLVNLSFVGFRDAVLESRGNKISESDHDVVFSAMPFSGTNAIKLGLVDATATSDALIEDFYYKGYQIILVNYVVKKTLVQKLVTG